MVADATPGVDQRAAVRSPQANIANAGTKRLAGGTRLWKLLHRLRRCRALMRAAIRFVTSPKNLVMSIVGR